MCSVLTSNKVVGFSSRQAAFAGNQWHVSFGHDVVAHLRVGKMAQASVNVIDQQTRHLPSHLQHNAI